MNLSLSTNDLIQHIISIGIDTHPPVRIPTVQTKLSAFADEARDRFPKLFGKVELGKADFVMSQVFHSERDATVGIVHQTLVITQRGPIFSWPLVLPPPIGRVGTEEEYLELFPELKDMFLRAIDAPACLRFGLVRDTFFGTGDEPCVGVLTSKDSFDGASLQGGRSLFAYRDDRHNVQITIEPGAIMRQTRLAVGRTITDPGLAGLRAILDVNNHELHSLTEDEMDGILTRASSLWPDALIEYLNSL